MLRIFEISKIQYGRQNGSKISKNAPTIFQHHKKYFSFEKLTSFILFSLGKWLKLILIIEKCFSKMWLLRNPRWCPCYESNFLYIFFKLWKLTTLYNFTISFCKFSMLLQQNHASEYFWLFLTVLKTKMAAKMAAKT